MPSPDTARRSSQPPAGTYRLQLGAALGFARAARLLPYLKSLGVTTAYLSPIFQSVRGGHGYDVTDPQRANEELGGIEELRRLCEAAAAAHLGLLIDIVPNHMAASTENPYWRDVIEKGQASEHAGMFAIDWDAPAAAGRLVLPVLPRPAGELIAGGELHLELDAGSGEILIAAGPSRFPVSPWSYAMVLESPAEQPPAALAPVLEAVKVLPPATHLTAQTAPEPSSRPDAARSALASATSALKSALATALRASPEVARYVGSRIARFGAGTSPAAVAAGSPTAAPLEELLESQPFRLMWWRDGLRIVNYRRFFDIADLVAVKQETPGVFELTHGLVRELAGWPGVAGFRVDHVDGLRNPLAYLEQLRGLAGDRSIVVEKILAEGEELPADWPVDGTTGYEFAAGVDRLLTDPAGWRTLLGIMENAGGEHMASFAELSRSAKREMLETLFTAEVATLARRLASLPPLTATSAPNANTVAPACPDESEVAAAIVELTAALRVYRTYIGPGSRRHDGYLEAAMDVALSPHRAGGQTAVRDLSQVLLSARHSDGGALDWVQDWQQLTGAAAAKGVEDTALYRYPVLLSHNEVGADPGLPPLKVAEFHERMQRRLATWPASLSATSTHDSKRDEDARARLDALSERADEWTNVLRRWRRLNQDLYLDLDGLVPTPLEENLVYQSLVALWPLDRDREASAIERLCAYALKAIREAKLETSWIDPNREHERAVEIFIRSILAPDRHEFLSDLRDWVREVAAAGAVNSLVATLLRIAAPGVPDTYQGTELWTTPRLVDPDNRAPVDFGLRERLLQELDQRAASDLIELLSDLRTRWADGRLKLYVLSRALRFRRDHPDLFLRGEYIPLNVTGVERDSVCAFARHAGATWALVVVPTRSRVLLQSGSLASSSLASEEPEPAAPHAARLELPPGIPRSWVDLLSGRELETERDEAAQSEAQHREAERASAERHVVARGEGMPPFLPLDRALALLPVALLAAGTAGAIGH